MALFKIFRGSEEDLEKVALHDGYAYFCTDSGKFFIDIASDGLKEEKRIPISAENADFLVKVTEEGEELFLKYDDIMQKTSISEGAMIYGGTDGFKELKGVGVIYASISGSPQFGILPVTYGGTGANNAAQAAQNLNVYQKADVDDKVDESTTKVYRHTILHTGWSLSQDVYSYTCSLPDLRCGKTGNIPPIITFDTQGSHTNKEEYSKIETATAEAQSGITFTIKEPPEADIDIIIIDVC